MRTKRKGRSLAAVFHYGFSTRSFMMSSGPTPNAVTAMDGSVKYRVSLVRTTALFRKLGHQAGMSSTTP